MPSTQNVLIFGPTGAVGRAAALEAKQRGAHVWLAMRDTNKAIPGIAKEADGFTRVQADLSQPETLKEAVHKSGATAAFVYTLFGSQDAMRSSIDALKAAGIKYIVLLSSYSVKGDASGSPGSMSGIEKIHSLVEQSVQATGIPFTALRPGYFNSNIHMFGIGEALKKGSMDVVYPESKLDYIAPEDIGAVAGAILSSPPKESQVIYLHGPKVMSQREAIGVIAKTLGKHVQVNEVGVAQWKEDMKGKLPDGALDSVAKSLGAGMMTDAKFESRAGNLEKWKGRKAIGLEEWVEKHKEEFA